MKSFPIHIIAKAKGVRIRSWQIILCHTWRMSQEIALLADNRYAGQWGPVHSFPQGHPNRSSARVAQVEGNRGGSIVIKPTGSCRKQFKEVSEGWKKKHLPKHTMEGENNSSTALLDQWMFTLINDQDYFTILISIPVLWIFILKISLKIQLLMTVSNSDTLSYTLIFTVCTC